MNLEGVLLIAVIAVGIGMSTSVSLECNELMVNARSECTCNETNRGFRTDITCNSLNVQLIERINYVHIVINCHSNPINISTVPGLIVESFTQFYIKDCHLINISLRELIDAFGHPDVSDLIISSTKHLKYSFDKHIFENLSKVTNIKMSSLNILNLSSEVFDELGKVNVTYNTTPQLKTLILERNRLKEVQPGTFKFLTNLMELDLSYNEITTLTRAAFSGLKSIRKLDLRKNKMNFITNDVFYELKMLQDLSLNENSIRVLHKDLLMNSTHLEVLDLSYNRISNIPEGFFESTATLTTLDLERNEIVTISGSLLAPLQNLQTLDLSNNRIEHFCEDQDLPTYKLTSLDLSSNKLKSLKGSNANKSTLISLSYIKLIYLSNNSLTQIYEDWYGMHSSIDLSHNQLQSVQITEFAKSALCNINSYNNRTPETYYGEDKGECASNLCIKLDNNPFDCDCKMFTFVNFLRKTGEVCRRYDRPSNTMFVGGLELTCTYPQSLQSTPLSGLSLMSLTCEKNDDENYHCPSQCTCTYRPADHANIIDCTSKDMDRIPSSLPLNWEADHTELVMSGNRLETVLVPADKEQQNITFMNLSNNHLLTFFISKDIHLKVLDLSYNKLTNLDKDTVSALGMLDHLVLHNNPWACDCGSLHVLRMIKESEKMLIGELTCADNRTMTELSDIDVCPGIGKFIWKHIWWFIAGGVTLLLITILTVLYVLYYKNKTRILTYCYSSHWRLLRWIVSHPDDLDIDKLHDAFISFADEDLHFVANTLVPHLEENGEGRYKLCLHYRDWVAGGNIINQIHTSIKRSRRTVIIMSPHFLQSFWGEAEFRTAHTKEVREGRQRLIVIMYKDIGPIEDLAKEMKDYLSTTTYLEWEDSPTFWKRLYYALPHPPGDSERVKINCFCFGDNTHPPTRQEECMELQTVQDSS